jgi:hypothetical protein
VWKTERSAGCVTTRRDDIAHALSKMNSELNVTTALINAIKFVEYSTGMITLAPDGHEWEWWRLDGGMRIGFRSTESQIDETKRQSVTTVLKEQGWSVFWSDDDDDQELWISFSLNRIYNDMESFLVGRHPSNIR